MEGLTDRYMDIKMLVLHNADHNMLQYTAFSLKNDVKMTKLKHHAPGFLVFSSTQNVQPSKKLCSSG
jgi:hypothetical protein